MNALVELSSHALTKRHSFSKIKEIMEMPNLIAIQRNSYHWFLDEGLKETFEEVSPITDFSDTLQLEFLTSSFGEPKYSVEECKDRDATYAAPLRIKVRLLNKESGEIKEQEVFMGDFPLITGQGTFLFNGAERFIASRLFRSPGVTIIVKLIQLVRRSMAAQLFQTVAHGWNWNLMPMTLCMCALTVQESFQRLYCFVLWDMAIMMIFWRCSIMMN